MGVVINDSQTRRGPLSRWGGEAGSARHLRSLKMHRIVLLLHVDSSVPMRLLGLLYWCSLPRLCSRNALVTTYSPPVKCDWILLGHIQLTDQNQLWGSRTDMCHLACGQHRRSDSISYYKYTHSYPADWWLKHQGTTAESGAIPVGCSTR